MTALWPARHVSIAIARRPDEVYAFVASPANLPRWAAGLAGSIVEDTGGAWIATSPMGTVTVRFAPTNTLGVLDHDVTLPSGETFHNPMRVVPNGDGSELSFTLFQRPGMSDAELEADARAIAADLRTLKSLLEP